MFKKVHIKNINAEESELIKKITEIYNKNITQIKNTLILEYVNEEQAIRLVMLKKYFSNKNETIIVVINGL